MEKTEEATKLRILYKLKRHDTRLPFGVDFHRSFQGAFATIGSILSSLWATQHKYGKEPDW
jgi:hypothetical protein